MKALTTEQNRVMVAVSAYSPKQVLEAKFKLAPFGYAYGYFDKTHYWSFPQDLEIKCLDILRDVFSNSNLKRLN